MRSPGSSGGGAACDSAQAPQLRGFADQAAGTAGPLCNVRVTRPPSRLAQGLEPVGCVGAVMPSLGLCVGDSCACVHVCEGAGAGTRLGLSFSTVPQAR